jgi:enoyl-CoA hydratase/carnithine racemase
MKQFVLSRPTPGYLRAEFDRPPINMLDESTITELAGICDTLETDHDLRVLVLSAVNPDFFMARYDFSAAPTDPADPFAGLRAFAQAMTRLSQSDVISIAALRGRARGGGSEIALACDMRFASVENCVLGQPEVPSGLLPAGGGIERLSRLVGRARATEIIVSGDDFDAVTAERYGWVNRAVPDKELDGFVDRLARRIASFDPVAVATAKRLIARNAQIPEAELRETISLLPSVAVASRDRRAKLRSRAARVGSDFELRLGYHLGAADER